MTATAIEKVKKSKPFTALDCFVVAGLLAVVAVSIALMMRAPTTTVTVTVDGESIDFSLAENRTVELEHLTVHIHNGSVWVTDADCPDKTCEYTGKISRAGQSIVCLPNGIVITLGGEGELIWELGK